MALPVLDKTWQHTVNQATGGGATNQADCQDTMLKIKNALKGFGLLPWTVWGSNDGTGAGGFGNGDAVDRWDTVAKLVWAAAGGNHSWMVLTQSGLGGNAAICIDLNNAGTYSNCTIVLSPAAGFGAVNGGANGTATARPTATDEKVLLSSANWGAYAAGVFVMRFHAMQSTDGQCTRVVLCYNNLACGLWQFDKVKSPIAAWVVPVLGTICAASNTEQLIYARLNDLATYPMSNIGAAACTFYYTSEGYTSGMVGENLVVADDDTGEWPVCQIGLACATAAHRGAKKGLLYDMYWGATTPSTGDTYPNDVTRTFAQFGDFVFPWNGSVPVVA